MKKSLLLLIPFLIISGCEKSKLKEIEKLSEEYKQCLVNQVLPEECDEIENKLEITELRAIQSSIDENKIDISIEIGEKLVPGDEAESPYKRIKRSVKSFGPISIWSERANFEPYLKKCPSLPDFSKDKDGLSRREIEAIEKYINRPKGMFSGYAYIRKDKEVPS